MTFSITLILLTMSVFITLGAFYETFFSRVVTTLKDLIWPGVFLVFTFLLLNILVYGDKLL